MIKKLYLNLIKGPSESRNNISADDKEILKESVIIAEKGHKGEIAVVVEGGMPFADVLNNTSSRQRAEHLFIQEGVWDTRANSGILVYLLLAEHKVEIIVDRGIVDKSCKNEETDSRQKTIEEICSSATSLFSKKTPTEGIMRILEGLRELLIKIPELVGDLENEIKNEIKIK